VGWHRGRGFPVHPAGHLLLPLRPPDGRRYRGSLIDQTDIRIRPARLRDDAALAELDAGAWSPDAGFPSVFRPGGHARGGFFNADNPPDAHLVAEAAGRVVGYVRLKAPTHLPENAHVVQVQGLAVHPDARRRGIAAMLLAAAEQRARDRGLRKLSLRVLSTNQGAISLYERLGFSREGDLREEFLINGSYVDDILMAKHLGPPA
jgi:ribosomal protein S18 acetylase RimI-like enzyme